MHMHVYSEKYIACVMHYYGGKKNKGLYRPRLEVL
jgi:hypothetical protein